MRVEWPLVGAGWHHNLCRIALTVADFMGKAADPTKPIKEKQMRNVPEAGKVFVIKRPFRTVAGVSYERGDTLELIEPTGQDPFGYGRGMPAWVVKCKHFSPPDKRSIWTGIWLMADEGIIEERQDG